MIIEGTGDTNYVVRVNEEEVEWEEGPQVGQLWELKKRTHFSEVFTEECDHVLVIETYLTRMWRYYQKGQVTQDHTLKIQLLHGEKVIDLSLRPETWTHAFEKVSNDS